MQYCKLAYFWNKVYIILKTWSAHAHPKPTQIATQDLTGILSIKSLESKAYIFIHLVAYF